MITKLVIRLLDAQQRLIGWTEHMALARGDGQLWSTTAVNIRADMAEQPAAISIHWADVNVEYRVQVKLPAMLPGQVVCAIQKDRPILRVGQQATGLPPVTVGSVTVGPPAGGSLLTAVA